MRKVLLALVLLAWPVASFGMDLGLLGGPVDFKLGVDTEIAFDLYVSSDVPFAACQWGLAADQAWANDGWTVSLVDPTGNQSTMNPIAGYGYGMVPVGTPLSDFYAVHGQAEIWFRDLTGNQAAGTYFMGTVTIKPIADMTAYKNQTFVLGVDPNNPNVMDETGAPVGTYQSLIVNIVPEPASALLLLLAAPFIRRRTA